MKKRKIYLDKYEKELEKAIERGEFVPVANQKKEIERYVSYAKAMLKKDKRLSVRIAKSDLEKIQKKAVEVGIPYQTLITSVLHLYAKGEIRLRI